MDYYSVIIMDEVYECFFNIDVFFGLFWEVVVWCLDLKFIVILVMMDVEKFVVFFGNVFIFYIFGCIFFVDIFFSKIL